MAVVNSSTISSINVSYDMAFADGMGSAVDDWSDLAGEYPSSTEETIYPWMLGIGTMEEWTGEKHHEDLAAVGYRLKNKDWSQGIEVDRNKIEDDQYGIYTPMLADLGYVAKDFINIRVNKLLQSYLTQGFAFDGKRFFATDHPVHPNKAELSTYSNLRTAKPLNRANLIAMRSAFAQVKGHDGEQRGIYPNVLCVHPDEEILAKELVQAAFLPGISGTDSGSRSNVLVDIGLKVRVLRRSTETGVWYLAATKTAPGVMRNPLIVQKRKAPVIVAPRPGSDGEYDRRVLRWSAEARYAFGYGDPRSMFRMEPS